MICPRCGTENGDSSLKCVKCWRPLQPVEKGPWLGSKTKPPEPPPKKQSPRSRRIASFFLVLGTLAAVWGPSVVERIREYGMEGLRGKVREAMRPVPAPRPPAAARKESERRVDVPSLGATVTALRFFESGYDPPPREKRVYTQGFPREECRFVNWELRLAHPPREARQEFRIEQVWHGPDGAVFARQSLQTHLDASWTYSFHHHGWGWRKASQWRTGEYRVDLFVAGNRVASGRFSVN